MLVAVAIFLPVMVAVSSFVLGFVFFFSPFLFFTLLFFPFLSFLALLSSILHAESAWRVTVVKMECVWCVVPFSFCFVHTDQ